MNIAGTDIKKFLEMDPEQFDQGTDGFRSLVGKVSEAYIGYFILEYIKRNAAKIEEYKLQNQKTKTKYLPVSLMYFHAGQSFAGSGSKYYKEAIECFKKGFDDGNDGVDDKDKIKRWNAYVGGTIAFLEGNKDKLDKQVKIIDQLLSPDMNRLNIEVLIRLSKALGEGVTDYYKAFLGRDSR